MATVEEINKTFAEKGLDLKLPLPGDWIVKDLQVLEKVRLPDRRLAILFRVNFYDSTGKENSDLFLCEGGIKAPRMKRSQVPPPTKLLKSTLLPLKEGGSFSNEAEALAYLKEAITHLLVDRDYHFKEEEECDLCFEKMAQNFFINLATRCDEIGLEKAKQLIALRQRSGANHDYGLVIPAFQESLGISLLDQEKWIYGHQDYLSLHQIGVYAVDNQDPNWLYPFTIYPRDRGLVKYFFLTSQQWFPARARYVDLRKKT